MENAINSFYQSKNAHNFGQSLASGLAVLCVFSFGILLALGFQRSDVPLVSAALLFGAVSLAWIVFCKRFLQLKEEILLQNASRVEQNLRMQAVEEMNQTKNVFLANMSHEIRTPLSAILGFVDLMDDPDLTPEERCAFSKIIRSNSCYLINVVNDILDISKMESGHLEISTTSTNIPAVVRSVVDMLQVKAAEKDLALRVKFCERLPELVFVDEARVRQILVNLVANAIKFTDSGFVEVEVSAVSHDDTSEFTLNFYVRDTGEGIDPAQHELLFDMFRQVEAGSSKRSLGTGIGLTLSRRLAQLMRGNVVISHSRLGEGSTFLFSVPVQAVGKSPSHLRSVPSSMPADRRSSELRV